MFDAAYQPALISDAITKLILGAIHFLNRTLPLIFEDKEFFMKAMWQEQE
jgi:hypothetical protein